MRESQQSACRVENAIIGRRYETIRDANNNTIFFIYRNTVFRQHNRRVVAQLHQRCVGKCSQPLHCSADGPYSRRLKHGLRVAGYRKFSGCYVLQRLGRHRQRAPSQYRLFRGVGRHISNIFSHVLREVFGCNFAAAILRSDFQGLEYRHGRSLCSGCGRQVAH
jgi:hypothetical protein